MRLLVPIVACTVVSLSFTACGGGDPASGTADAGVADGGIDHPTPLCDDSTVHLRGDFEGVDVAADLCDFQYALLEHDPWLNWTKFEDGVLLMTGDVNIFQASEASVAARSGLLRMPGVTQGAGRVYCGSNNGSYYESRDETAPDAEFTLAFSGYAGTCGGTGQGTLDLTSSLSNTGNTVTIALGDTPMELGVGGSYADGEEFSFFIDGGFVNVFVTTPLDTEVSGTTTIATATIALRDGTTRMLIACGDAAGTLTQTHTDLGNEYELHLTGLAPWLDCDNTTPATGSFTLTHD